MWTAIAWAAAIGMLSTFILWVSKLARENERLDDMAKREKAQSTANQRVADVLVNDDWARRLRDKAANKSKD